MNYFLKTFSLIMSSAILNQKSKMIYLEGMSMSVRNMVLKKSNLIYHHHSIVQKMTSLSVPLKDFSQKLKRKFDNGFSEIKTYLFSNSYNHIMSQRNSASVYINVLATHCKRKMGLFSTSLPADEIKSLLFILDRKIALMRVL